MRCFKFAFFEYIQPYVSGKQLVYLRWFSDTIWVISLYLLSFDIKVYVVDVLGKVSPR